MMTSEYRLPRRVLVVCRVLGPWRTVFIFAYGSLLWARTPDESSSHERRG